jgi:hypothetical protein
MMRGGMTASLPGLGAPAEHRAVCVLVERGVTVLGVMALPHSDTETVMAVPGKAVAKDRSCSETSKT